MADLSDELAANRAAVFDLVAAAERSAASYGRGQYPRDKARSYTPDITFSAQTSCLQKFVQQKLRPPNLVRPFLHCYAHLEGRASRLRTMGRNSSETMYPVHEGDPQRQGKSMKFSMLYP